jgi:hypothetical protein
MNSGAMPNSEHVANPVGVCFLGRANGVVEGGRYEVVARFWFNGHEVIPPRFFQFGTQALLINEFCPAYDILDFWLSHYDFLAGPSSSLILSKAM